MPDPREMPREISRPFDESLPRVDQIFGANPYRDGRLPPKDRRAYIDARKCNRDAASLGIGVFHGRDFGGLVSPIRCPHNALNLQRRCRFVRTRTHALARSRGVFSRRHPPRIRGRRSRIEPPGLFHGVRNDRYTYTPSGSH